MKDRKFGIIIVVASLLGFAVFMPLSRIAQHTSIIGIGAIMIVMFIGLHYTYKDHWE